MKCELRVKISSPSPFSLSARDPLSDGPHPLLSDPVFLRREPSLAQGKASGIPGLRAVAVDKALLRKGLVFLIDKW